jgi:hypothetical protein
MSAPVVLHMARNMPGPANVVWDLITDWEHQDDWMLEASDFVVVSDIRSGVGVEAEATVRIAGIATRDRVRVIGWEPDRRLAIEHLGWVSGVAELVLHPLDDGTTRLDWTERLRPPWGLLGAVGLRAFRPVMLRIFRRDLRVLEGLVRARVQA